MTGLNGSSSNNAENVLVAQYVSDPVGGQTIAGTVEGVALGIEGHQNHDSVSAIKIYIVSNNGATVRGNLLAIKFPALAATNEYSSSTATNRFTPIVATLTSQNAQNGDRIVIEIGYHRYGTTPAGSTTLTFGDNSATDLAYDQSTTTANNPWVLFSQDIKFPTQGLIEF
jgi:hypothetical protein